MTFDSHDHCHSSHFVNVRRTTSETAAVFLQKVPLPQHGQLVYNKEGHVQAEMYERVRNSSVRAISNPLPPTGTSTGTSTGETKEEFCPSRYCHHHAECTSTFDLYLTWFQRSPPTHSWHCSPLAKYYDPRPIPKLCGHLLKATSGAVGVRPIPTWTPLRRFPWPTLAGS